jgi:hypothetical protein
MSSPSEYPYIWTWDECSGCVHKRKKPRECPPGCSGLHPAWNGRKGKRCRVVARGAKNTGVLEFKDGYRTTVDRRGLKRAKR